MKKLRCLILISSLLLLSSSLLAQGTIGVCDASSTRTSIRLATMDPEIPHIYYRLDRHVVLLDLDSVVRYFRTKPIPNPAMANRLEEYKPLNANTDVFQPFLYEILSWTELRYMLAEMLENGLASVVDVYGDSLSSIELESYTTSSCQTGRRFLAARSGLVFSVIDSEA